MNKDEIRKIVSELLIENERNLSPISGRDLFWNNLRGVVSTWIYMHGNNPLASVWWSNGRWQYSIPILDKTGDKEFREDAMARVETYLAESDSTYIAALG